MVTSFATAWLEAEALDPPRSGAESALALRGANRRPARATRHLREAWATRPPVHRRFASRPRCRCRCPPRHVRSGLQAHRLAGGPGAAGRLDLRNRATGWCLEYRKSAKRRHRTAGPEEGAIEVAHQGPSPETTLAARESAAVIERALAVLEPDRRAVLLMRCDHQLSHQEIAMAMGFSVAKVKVEIFRARSALRAALQNEGATDDGV